MSFFFSSLLLTPFCPWRAQHIAHISHNSRRRAHAHVRAHGCTNMFVHPSTRALHYQFATLTSFACASAHACACVCMCADVKFQSPRTRGDVEVEQRLLIMFCRPSPTASTCPKCAPSVCCFHHAQPHNHPPPLRSSSRTPSMRSCVPRTPDPRSLALTARALCLLAPVLCTTRVTRTAQWWRLSPCTKTTF